MFNMKTFSEYYSNIGNLLLDCETKLPDILEYYNYDYCEASKHITKWIKTTFKDVPNYEIPFIVFEGERCAGKDSVIDELSENSDFVPLPRKTNNLAWSILNERKQNCYFKLDNPIESTFLWYSDLAFRISSWEIDDFSKTYLANRYIDSACICIKSCYDNDLSIEEKQSLEELLDSFRFLFPVPEKTLILDVTQETQRKRLFETRGRVLSKEEEDVAIKNIKCFSEIDFSNVYHVDANQVLEDVMKSVYNCGYDNSRSCAKQSTAKLEDFEIV